MSNHASTSLANLDPSAVALLADGPTNEQILGAAKRFYAANNKVISATSRALQATIEHGSLNRAEWQELPKSTPVELPKWVAQICHDVIFDTAAFSQVVDEVKASDHLAAVGFGATVSARLMESTAVQVGCSWDSSGGGAGDGYNVVIEALGLQIGLGLGFHALVTSTPSGLSAGPLYRLIVVDDLRLILYFTGTDTPVCQGFSITEDIGLEAGAQVFGGKATMLGVEA